MPNHLIAENSPYLLQHADNPVDWYAWGEEALVRARAEDKPIFLSIGYAACHWCHVMAHESFEDPEIAEILNENFVNIKVDREERPDLDSIYMNAVVALTGQGGWPLSVFLTPDLQPFYGGTYFPPARRYNIPSFQEVILAIARLWKEDRQQINKSSEAITAHLIADQTPRAGGDQTLRQEVIEQSVLRLAQGYDWKNGGWGQAPKVPQPMTLEFLLRRAAQGDKLGMDLAVNALDAMARGGMYDLIGGGFARYSTDDQWLVPHFEKMLYDNALLARCYLYAHLLTRDAGYLHVCRATLDFVQRELTNPLGGFYSSLDADSEGEEGKYYLWTYAALVDQVERLASQLPALSGASWTDVFNTAYGVARGGNFEGAIVLQRALNDLELSEKFSLSLEQIQQGLDIIQRTLLDQRQARVRPGADDKALTAWNGFMLLTLAEAARYLNDAGYLRMAQQNAAFLVQNLFVDGRLYRSWRNGIARHTAYLEDYAALALGLLALYQTDHNPVWFRTVRRLIDKIVSDYTDPSGGFFDTAADQKTPLLRPKDVQDNTTPCGNSLAAMALLQFSAFTGSGAHRELAEQMLAAMGGVAVKYPTAFANWLCAYDFSLAKSLEIAILFPPEQADISRYTELIWGGYRPNWVLAASQFPLAEVDAPEILHNRKLDDQRITAYVCEKFFCRQPVSDPESFRRELELH